MSTTVTLQKTVNDLLMARPDYRRNLEEMIVWEEANPRSSTIGWSWKDVHTFPKSVDTLVGQGIVDCVYNSRSATLYRLVDLAEVKATLSVTKMISEPSPSDPITVDGMFNLIVGHDSVKRLVKRAIAAAKPVHILLWGPPGNAKTMFLSEVGNLPGSYFYMGSTTTKSGLVSLLLRERPAFLVIDEIDKMSLNDVSPLLNLMESHMVTRLQYGKNEREFMNTKVFAGANSLERLSKTHSALISRFAVRYIPAYSRDEFVMVSQKVLVTIEHQLPSVAELIAREVSRFSSDVRDAVKVSTLANGDPQAVIDVVECMWPRR